MKAIGSPDQTGIRAPLRDGATRLDVRGAGIVLGALVILAAVADAVAP